MSIDAQSCRHLAAQLAHRRYAIVGLIAAVLGSLQWAHQPVDFQVFAVAGRHLWTGEWDQVYRDPVVQAGPLQLGLIAAVRPLGQLGGTLDYGLFNVIGPVVFALGLMSIMGRFRAFTGAARGPQTELVVAVLALIWGWATDPCGLGHPAEILVPAAWLLAGMAAARNRPGQSGALLALATGLETWALLGVPILLLLPSLRRATVAALTFTGGCLALWLPFVLSGGFSMGRMDWLVDPSTPVGRIFGVEDFTSPMRTFQLLAGLAVGTTVAVATRTSVHSTWLVPLAAVLTRLLFDPRQSDYYWLAPCALMFVALGAVEVTRSRAMVAMALLAYLQVAAYAGFARPAMIVLSFPAMFGTAVLLSTRAAQVDLPQQNLSPALA